MATAIRAIPTLYGETAKSFECEAKRTEQNPGTQDYLHLEVDSGLVAVLLHRVQHLA